MAVPRAVDVIRRVGRAGTPNPQTTSEALASRTTIFRSERAEKLLSFLQVRVLPQESIRCLRSYGVHVEGEPLRGSNAG
jgi:hypothetical protein